MFCSAKVTGMTLAASACVLMLLRTTVDGFNLDTKFPIIYKSTFGDYFGFTVALHKNREGSLALVGAPRANSSFLPVHQPGVLYKCTIPKNNEEPTCSEVVLDTKGNTQTVQGSELSYYDKKDDMWLGVSLDVQRKKNADIVTCGHLWKNQYYRGHHLANGVCYVIDSELDPSKVVKLVPLIRRTKQAIIPPGIYYYAFGQAGTSVAFHGDGQHLLLGAPGIYDWVGSIVSYASDTWKARYQYNNPVVPDPPSTLAPESYFGYAVTTGLFFSDNDIYYAVGAPRDKDNHGRVYIFKPPEQKKNEIFVHQKKEGTQFGEYFGASLLSVSLNGNSMADLLVGAPFFSLENGGDEGKVYVYISNGVGLQAYAELMGSSKPNARFGTALANVGDLNQDGCFDIAVGAPYEDEKGAIYIYHGSTSGMNVQYVQRIAAADISPALSGFGIYISRGLDIDDNKYPDILVGSYASSNAVLFRTHPVIQLNPRLIFSPNQINMNLTTCEFGGEKLPCVNVTACLVFYGSHFNLPLRMVHEIYVEHPSQTNLITPRGFFVQNGRQHTVIRQNIMLDIGTESCSRHLLHIRPGIKDFITPIQILYRYWLAEPPDADKYFHKTFPVIDQDSPTNITSAVSFQTGCGKEDTCLSDLVVTATMLGSAGSGQLILGEVSSVSLSITVQNKGEHAYLSELLIFLPPDMPSINQDSFCASSTQGNNASLVCDLGNPLKEHAEVRILVKLDVTKIPTDRKALDIFLKASTVSTEISPENNELRIPLLLKAVADIGITGISSQEQILYDEDEEIELPVPIVHTYTIRNNGPSPLQVIDITLYVPKSFTGPNGKMEFLTFTSLEVDSGKQLTIPAKCNDTYLDIKSVVPEVKHRGQAFGEDDLVGPNEGNASRRHYNHSSDIIGATSNLTLNSDEDEILVYRSKKSVDKKEVPKTRETIVINCETENVECISIQCTASPFTDTRKIAQITVAAQVNLTILNNFLGAWYRVELMTSGHVSMRDSNVDLQHHVPDVAQVKTVFVHKGPPPSEELAWWIIIVSIAAGILLLLIILILLIKFGFFKREQKEQMQKILDAENKDYERLEGEPNEKDALNH